MKWIVLTLAVLVVTAAPASAQTEATVYRAVPSSDVSLPSGATGGTTGGALLARLLEPALGRRRRGQGLALGAPLSARWIPEAPSSSMQRCLFRSTAFALPRARPTGPVPRGTTRSTYIRSSAATGCASERSRSAPRRPDTVLGRNAATARLGCHRPRRRMGRIRRAQRRSAAEACGRRGRLPRQRPEAAVVRVRERGPQARTRGDLPAALAVLATASPRGTS